jgi:hypothetical protein
MGQAEQEQEERKGRQNRTVSRESLISCYGSPLFVFARQTSFTKYHIFTCEAPENHHDIFAKNRFSVGMVQF